MHPLIRAVELFENVTVPLKVESEISALVPVTKLTGHPTFSTPEINTGPLMVIVFPVPFPNPVVTICTVAPPVLFTPPSFVPVLLQLLTPKVPTQFGRL
jgi:hypothetical protein